MTHLDDCIVILEYLAASGQQSLRKMQADTGIPFSTIREYINPKVLVRKSWATIESMRKNQKAYEFYVSTLEKPDKEGASINISKFGYLQHYGMRYGYYVYFSQEKHKIFVEKITNLDDFWTLV